MSPPLLKVESLRVSYGRLVAVRDVSLEVAKGAAVAIVGPNGAGKSTALNAIAGGVRDVVGRVALDGRSILRQRPESIARLGVSLVPEGRHVFATLTVEENLLIGGYLRSSNAQARQDMHRILEYFPRLKERLSQPAGKLSGGEQQMLVIGRALMTKPRLILVDEPSLGLAPKIIDEVYELLLALRKDQGLSLLINEQNSKRVLKFLDEIYVLRAGAIQIHGRCDDLLGSTSVTDAYFGNSAFSKSHETTGVQ